MFTTMKSAPAPNPPQCTFNDQCPGGGPCINGTCHTTCTTDADCPDSADACVVGVCRADVGRTPACLLNSDCATGQECVNGQCKNPCFSATDCENCEGQPICHAGYCASSGEASPQCKLANDCSSTQSCIDAQCISN